MPEGDTIYRTAQTLDRALGRRAVTRFASVLPALTRIDEDAPLAGRTVERVWAQGKHLLIGFSGDLVLRTHMRMNGSWHIYRPGERWRRPRHQVRLVIETDAFVAVAFNVPVAEFYTARKLARERALRDLGPDLLGETFDAAAAVARLRERGALAIGDALLDQRALAGIGNVYKSEVCFVCRVNPFTRVDHLSDDDLRSLVQTARRLLQANVAPGTGAGIVTYHPLRRTTARADAEDRLWVYGRGKRACRRCRTPIERKKQGADARSTYWCPRCQRASGASQGA
jgi:endonuclease-8